MLPANHGFYNSSTPTLMTYRLFIFYAIMFDIYIISHNNVLLIKVQTNEVQDYYREVDVAWVYLDNKKHWNYTLLLC